jgi:hypothetical protein
MDRRIGRPPMVWDELLSAFIHPIKVAIVEAMLWINEPVSPKLLDLVFDEKFGLSLVSYHLRSLFDNNLVEKAGNEPVRGALQTFYVVSAPRGS